MAPSSSRPCGADASLCDDLLQEVFRLLPPAAVASASLVSRRWLVLLRASTFALSLHLPPDGSAAASLAALLSHYPCLSALAVVVASADADEVLLAVAAAPSAARLSALRFLPGSAVNPTALLAASPSFRGLASLHLSALLPLSFRWLALLPRLTSFSLVNSAAAVDSTPQDDGNGDGDADGVGPLPLERLSLCGIRSGDRGLAWLWRRCGRLRWLQLRACEGTGDGPSSPAFAVCLADLIALELRACRSVASRVLFLAADLCRALNSLLVYDGGSRDALHRFIHRRGAALHTLDLRLPLDLHNDHLHLLATHSHGHGHSLAALRLQSCVLITGDGLRSLATACMASDATGAGIQELALVSCDVVEREPGLLTFLSQSMRRLRRLDISYNEALSDKEVCAMLSSCHNLVDLRLRGCRSLTGAFFVSLLRHCGRSLEVVDISRCPGIAVTTDVELFARECTRLNQIIIDESSVSEELLAIAHRKGINIGSFPCE